MRVPGTNFDYGRPQFFATLLLLFFLAQCVWKWPHYLVPRFARPAVYEGLQALESGRLPDPESLLSALPLKIVGINSGQMPQDWWARLAIAPFVAFGLALGASLWYVARRLYGNLGGYIALALFASSNQLITTTLWISTSIPFAFFAFGSIFTAVALAHTLYAPPQARWVRTGLFTIAFALSLAFSWIGVLVGAIATCLLFYLAPGRARLAAAVSSVATLVGVLLWYLWIGREAHALLAWLPSSELHSPPFGQLALQVGAGYAASAITTLLLLIALFTWAVWRRTRYFGNTLPLVCLLLIWSATTVETSLFTNHFVAALPFAYLFIAGTSTDLIESPYGRPALIAITVVLVVRAALSLRLLATYSYPTSW